MGVCNGALNLHIFGVVHMFPKNVQLLWGYVIGSPALAADPPFFLYLGPP